jgi:hypothetical protein
MTRDRFRSLYCAANGVDRCQHVDGHRRQLWLRSGAWRVNVKASSVMVTVKCLAIL